MRITHNTAIRAILFVIVMTFLAAVTPVHAAITVARTSGTTLYTDTGTTNPGMPNCGYISLNVTDTTTIADAWVTINGFTGGYLSLGGGDDGAYHIGSLLAGQTKPVFYYICTSYTGGISPTQTYDIKLYNGNPSAGGSQIDTTTTLSMTIDNTVIKANANSVNVIVSGPNPATLGGIITMTVDGDTGTIGCVNPPSTCTGSAAGPMYFTPATFSNWRADAFELVGSNVTLSGGNSGSYDNTLYINSVPSSSDTHYVATYYFRAVGTTGVTTTLSPVSYIASGTQIKHTSLSSGAYSVAGGLQPVESAQAAVVLTKAVSHATLPAQGGRVTYTLTATNTGLAAVSLDSFIDVLPAGATYVTGSSSFNGTGMADPGITGTTLTWSSLFSIPAGTSRTLVFQADLPATPGTYTNAASARVGTVVIDSTLSVSDNAPATATTVVLKAPTITKAFSPSAVAVSGTSTLTLTITNPNAGQTLNGIAVTDTLPSSPAGLGFAVPSGAATTCSGAVLTVTGTTIGISGGTLAAGQSCTVTANVTSASANTTYTNTTGTVSSTNGGTGSTASATVTFSTKPTITKSFSVPTIPQNDTATMTLTITNNGTGSLTGLTFDDLFPAGMITANPPTVTPASPCGGTLSAWNGTTVSTLTSTGGDAGIRLAGGTIASAGTCSFTVNVTAAAAGVYANTTGGVNSNETSPAGPGSNTATLSALSPPTVTKAFLPSTIGKGQTSTLTITLTNANATAITGAAFTDTYPANVTTAAIPNNSTTCTGGTVNSTSGSVSLSGGTIPANGSCTVSIDVTSSVVNSYTNTIPAGAVTTTNAGSNGAAASATLMVNATPTITKTFSFNATTGIATMSITIVNNHTAGISGLSFTDLFPAGMTTTNPPALSPATPCGTGSSLQSWNGATAGTLSTTGGDLGVKLTAGQIPAAGGSCTFTVNLAANSLGVYTNQTSGVTLTTPFSGTGSVSNTATWIAPAVSKTFTPNTVGPGDISRMVISITNPSTTTSLTGLTLNDTYPTTATLPTGGTLNGAAITNSATPNVTSTCGGTVTAVANGTAISLTGGSLPAGGACTIAADIHATNTTPATYYNTTGKGASDQGIGITGSDALYVVTKPTIRKSFLTSPVTISGGTATSVMRIVVENNAGADITSVSFTDTFPSNPSQMKWVNTVANSCGGTLTDAAGAALVSNSSTGIKLTGGAITAAAVTCTIDVTVSVSATGSHNNTTSGATSSTNTSPGPNSNTATLVAYLTAPTVTKAFANSGFQVGGTNRLTITLTNPNGADVTGVNFTDTFPANLSIAAVPNLSSTCGGTATAAAGTATLSLAGGTIPTSGACSLAVDVTTATVGTYTNTLSTNAITSTNANPTPSAPVSSSTTAYLPPTVTKSFSPATIGMGGNSSLVITVANPAANPANLTGVSINDAYTGTLANNAAGGVVCSAGSGATLTGGINGGTSVGFSGGTITPGGSCTITQSVTATSTVSNTTTAPVATGPANPLTGTAASATLTVFSLPSLVFVKQASTAAAAPGQIITYTLLTTNSGLGIATSVVLSDAMSPYIAWGVNSFGANVPFQMIDGSPAAGLTLGTPVYSNDNGATWTYVPSSGAGGAPVGYDGNVTNWRIPMTGTMNGNGANFTLQYKVMVK
ncbi:DUF11 domain-containing protein [Geobacter sp. AOG1]|uniref:beta strand repeat-containing protein n=1 Tax=Geobacter sp. AOG1 TaxID=1566346 RepID=UPI001CC4CB3A|nr:DUF11 domain-containing protein [Geobacter sp. AOG1]GFE57585.1 hypothetical protein AOG1_14650 [Geobacter sp. AOG1]